MCWWVIVFSRWCFTARRPFPAWRASLQHSQSLNQYSDFVRPLIKDLVSANYRKWRYKLGMCRRFGATSTSGKRGAVVTERGIPGVWWWWERDFYLETQRRDRGNEYLWWVLEINCRLMSNGKHNLTFLLCLCIRRAFGFLCVVNYRPRFLQVPIAPILSPNFNHDSHLMATCLH